MPHKTNTSNFHTLSEEDVDQLMEVARTLREIVLLAEQAEKKHVHKK